jgi:hypothetical protein
MFKLADLAVEVIDTPINLIDQALLLDCGKVLVVCALILCPHAGQAHQVIAETRKR